MLETKAYPRLGDLTKDVYQQQLSLDYAKWLGCLAENGRHDATKNFLLRYPSSVGAALVKKTATAAGTTTDSTWAAPLAAVRPLQDAFVALARGASLLGRIPNLRRIPFNVKAPTQTGEANYQWVAQNAMKPVSSLAFSDGITLAPTKCTAIVVVTRELVELTTRGMEGALRDTLIGGLTAFTDNSFLNPASTAIAATRPASVTSGTTPITATGDLHDDVAALLAALFADRPNADSAVLIANAAHGAALRGMNPGFGVTILVSSAALENVIAMDPTGVFVADQGVEVDISREASIQMNDSPDNPATASTVHTSLWQNNLAGFRVERFVGWQAVSGAVHYLAPAAVRTSGRSATR